MKKLLAVVLVVCFATGIALSRGGDDKCAGKATATATEKCTHASAGSDSTKACCKKDGKTCATHSDSTACVKKEETKTSSDDTVKPN